MLMIIFVRLVVEDVNYFCRFLSVKTRAWYSVNKVFDQIRLHFERKLRGANGDPSLLRPCACLTGVKKGLR